MKKVKGVIVEFSLDPIAVLENIFKNRRQKKEDFIDYMNIVAKQALALASIWEKAVNDIEKFSYNYETINEEIRKWRTHNWPIFYELEEYYQSFSSVSHRYINSETKESIINHISNLLMQRNLTRELYQDYSSKLNKTILISEKNKIDDFSNLHSSVKALQKEAAKIQAIANSLKLTLK